MLHHGEADIAVIGMAARLPGADDLEAFWSMLCQGREGLTHFQVDEVLASGEPFELVQHADYVRTRGVFQGADLFDAGFFNMSPVEAEYTDPQQRMFLEYCATALQGAGYHSGCFEGLIGVFGGAAHSNYLQQNVLPNVDSSSTSKFVQVVSGNDKDFLTTRVSHKLDLQGPSYSIQTACSTSLVAVHAACQALISGECDLALAGGVTIRTPQACGYLYEVGGLVSKDGHVRPFDAAANGTVPGNGVGVVVLKLLQAALRDGDTVHAVIKGTATNNDGGSRASYAAPGKAGQVAVIREAHAVSGVGAETIGYVEAQGSATKLGDALEVAALTEAFRRHTQERGFCALGCVKSNVGALDAAGGVASLLKVVLMLRERALVPTVHYREPNPNIDFGSSPFFVNAELREWIRGATPRRAAVSSFGLGGTNAHVILEEAPAVSHSGPGRPQELLILSAQSQQALRRMQQELAVRLRREPALSLADVAYTLAVGRPVYRHRYAWVSRDLEAACSALEQQTEVAVTHGTGGNAATHGTGGSAATHGTVGSAAPALCFLFEADVPDAQQRALELVEAESAFSVHFKACVEQGALAAGHSGAVFAYQYAIARLWLEWGLEPVVLRYRDKREPGMPGVGLAAACVGGALELSEAVALLAQGQSLPLNGELRAGWCRVEAMPVISEGIPARDLSVLDVSRDAPLVGLRRAWSEGARVNWSRYYAGQQRRRLPLPTYPFERQRYWMNAPRNSRSVGSWAEARPSLVFNGGTYSNGGIYLVRAGSDRLGLLIAEHLASLAQTRLTVVGESVATPTVRARLAAIRAAGSSVRFEYVRPHAAAEDLQAIIARVSAEVQESSADVEAGAVDTTELLNAEWIAGQSDQELARLVPAVLALAGIKPLHALQVEPSHPLRVTGLRSVASLGQTS